jgi:tetratricopeptide (TPR) repeat protein
MQNNNPPYNDKVLKIFTSIRCLNRDQLPRYLEGRLTEVEKHLVEQHLTDCDLCFEALQALEKEPNMDRYNGFTSSVQQFIHQSVRPVSHVQRVAQYARKEQKKESMLAYFWLLAFLLLGVGSIFVLKGHLRNQSVIASNKAVMVPDTTRETAPAPLAENKPQEITTHPSSAAIVSNTSAAVTPAPVVHHPPVTKPAKDSVTTKKPAAPAKPAVPAPQKTKDSVVKKAPAPAPKAPDTLKKEEDKPVQVVKSIPTAPLEDATTKDQDADKQDKTEKKPTPSVAAPPPSNNDEYLYKAAMVYQQQGDLGEAINRYKRLADISTGRYAELSRYQLAICYRSKGQAGKARRMFREVVRMNGSMKDAAQKALDSM